LLAPAVTGEHRQEDVVKNIMVATDGSEAAGEALDTAIELARQMGAKLQVLSVRPPRVHGRAGSGPAITEIEELHGSDHIADAAVQRARAAGVEATRHVSHGPVADRIVEAATELEVDLLVVGSTGMGALRGALVGSVSHALVGRSPVPLMVVHRAKVPVAVES
jgi:nucleotide-binding universal stress UspA family protein